MHIMYISQNVFYIILHDIVFMLEKMSPIKQSLVEKESKLESSHKSKEGR